MKTKKFALVGVIFAVLSILTWFGCQDGESIHIALVGPLTNPTGESLVNSVNLYLEKLNKAGGVNGKKVVLDTYDEENDSQKARKIAQQIAEQKQAVAVIGHNWSSCSISAGEIYKEKGVPAITPVSTNVEVTQDNEWYFRTIFDDNLQGRFLANYAQKILKHDTASIIYEQDRPYGDNLAKIFEQSANEIGLNINYKWGFESKAEDVKTRIKEIVDELALQKEAAGIIFIAAHAVDGIEIVRLMKDMEIPNDIIVPDAFGNKRFSDGFNALPQEIENPGFYTNGIYVTTPMLFDTANQMAQTFREDYRKKYLKEPDGYGPFAYDAAKLIIDAIKNTGIKGVASTIQEDRKKIKEYLAGLTKIEDAVQGLTGLNYFNAVGDCRKPISIGVFRSTNVISALGQLSPVQYMNLVPNVDEAIEQNRIIMFDNDYMYKTNVVYTGIELKGIEALDVDKNTCKLDFFIWFRFKGDIDGDNIEFLNAIDKIELPTPIEEGEKQKTVQAAVDDTVDDENAGSASEARAKEGAAKPPADQQSKKKATATLVHEDNLYGLTSRLYHVEARFKTGLDIGQAGVKEFHTLGFGFRHRNLSRNNLIYVTDVLGMGLDGDLSFTERLKQGNALSGDSGWLIYNASFFQSTTPKSTMGDLRYLDIQNKFIDFSQFNFHLLLKADTFSIRRKIPTPPAYFIAGGSLVLLIFLMIMRRKIITFKITWFLELICVFVLLLSAEVVAIAFAAETAEKIRFIRFTILAFDILWWLAPAYWVHVALDPFVWAAMREQTGRPVPTVLRRFPAYIIYFVAGYGVIAFALDKDVTKLMATSGAVAMIIGLVVKDNIANYFASISLIQGYDLKIDNWVKFGDYEEGKIVEITKVATSIRTRGGTTLSIPNSAIMGMSIHNFDFPDDSYTLTFTFETVDSYSPDHVKEVTQEALLGTECVLKDPEPVVLFEGQGDSSAIFTVLFTVRDYAKKGPNKSAAWRSVWLALERADIELATPNRIIHLAEKESEDKDIDKQPSPTA